MKASTRKMNEEKRRLDKAERKGMFDLSEEGRRHLNSAGQDYLEAVVSPRTAKPCGIPTLIGGEPGLTGKVKLKQAGVMVTGTAGFGYIAVGTPEFDGFYSNRVIGMVTNAAFTGTIVSMTTATTGVAGITFADSPYAVGAAANDSDIVAYRLVGLEVSIKPIGSALSQDGQITLLEAPNHHSLAGLNFQNVRSYKQARTVSGIKFGDYEDELVLNIHPRSRTGDGLQAPTNPFAFRYSSNVSSTQLNGAVAVIAVEATAGLRFEWEMFAIYESRGFKVQNPTPTYTDSKSMDRVLNVFRDKHISGWSGKPSHAKASYLSKVVHTVSQEAEDGFYSNKLKQIWKEGRQAWDLVKNVGGFLL